MARFADWLSRVRLVYKRSSLTLKIMVLCAIVVSIVTLSVFYIERIRKLQKQYA